MLKLIIGPIARRKVAQIAKERDWITAAIERGNKNKTPVSELIQRSNALLRQSIKWERWL